LQLGLNPKMKAVAQFVATAFGIYIAWYIFHDFYLIPKTNFVELLINLETKQSAFLLQKLPLRYNFDSYGSVITCNGSKALRVGAECNALVLFVLFAGFILAYPGNWKTKAWYIPIGIVCIYILNIFRIIILTVNFKYFRSSFSFNHHVTFTYLIYGFIFLLWMIWVNKFNKNK
jgi:exosortase family protein XrtF